MTERLDDMKLNLNTEVDQVKFRLREVSNSMDILINQMAELQKHFKEENNARSAEIYNLVSEVQEIKTEKMSAFTHSHGGENSFKF